MPSVPTSLATRVTSAANEDSWSTIVLTVLFRARISPRASTVIFWVRSPLATAVVTWAMLRTWSVRLPAMKFTLSVRSFQVPDTPFTRACPPSLPSVPTSRATRVTSSAKLESYLLAEVAIRHGLDHARDLGGRSGQVFDQRVEGVHLGVPAPAPGGQA